MGEACRQRKCGTACPSPSGQAKATSRALRHFEHTLPPMGHWQGLHCSWHSTVRYDVGKGLENPLMLWEAWEVYNYQTVSVEKEYHAAYKKARQVVLDTEGHAFLPSTLKICSR